MDNIIDSSKECIDHPLGILCRCKEYREIVEKFVINTVGTRNRQSPDKLHHLEEPPVYPPTVIWIMQKAEANANPTKPILHYDDNLIVREVEKITEKNVENSWIPANTNLVSVKELRPNTSYLHKTAQNTQSADISVLTDMLPHRGRPIKRRDIDWDIGSHATPVRMTDVPETKFYSVKGCFSTWAEAYTRATGRPAY